VTTTSPNDPTTSQPLVPNLEELDLVKFQLLSSYLGMAKQEGETLAREQELLTLKQENSSVRIEHATTQLTTFNQYLVGKYHLIKGDQLDYGTGTIKRGTLSESQSHEDPQAQASQTKEV